MRPKHVLVVAAVLALTAGGAGFYAHAHSRADAACTEARAIADRSFSDAVAVIEQAKRQAASWRELAEKVPPPPADYRGSDPEPPETASRADQDESGAKGGLWFHRDPGPDLKVLNAITAAGDHRRRQEKLARENLFLDYLPAGPEGIADLLEPHAVVVAQHPHCFTPPERTDAEVGYQRWRRLAEKGR